MFDETSEEEAELRDRWRTLVEQRLPRAARRRKDWPVYLDHCFARILLDNAFGMMWRKAIQGPAWRNTPLPVLQTAIDLGEEVLANTADLWALNDAARLRLAGAAVQGGLALKRGRLYARASGPICAIVSLICSFWRLSCDIFTWSGAGLRISLSIWLSMSPCRD
jgi:hypothetical protein